jgi:hypothetical protein
LAGIHSFLALAHKLLGAGLSICLSVKWSAKQMTDRRRTGWQEIAEDDPFAKTAVQTVQKMGEGFFATALEKQLARLTMKQRKYLHQLIPSIFTICEWDRERESMMLKVIVGCLIAGTMTLEKNPFGTGKIFGLNHVEGEPTSFMRITGEAIETYVPELH